MKKSLVMIFVVILVLSMQVCFAAFPDIEGSRYKTAIEYLNSISIVSGYEDNTYKPEKVVTRAEMAKFLVTAMKADVESTSNSSEFLDVADWHWAVRYINVAQKNELIKGDGDGNFRPDDTVSYGEAFTMVVRMLGYDIDVEGTGVWPNNYIDRAKELKLIENVESFTNEQGANRGSIAQIIYNAINNVYTKEEYPLIKLVNKVFDIVNNQENSKDLYNNENNSLKTNLSFNLDFNENNEEFKQLDEEDQEIIKIIENLVNDSQIDIRFKFDLIKEYAQYIIEYFFENEELLEVELNIDKNKVYLFIKDVFDKYLKSESEESFFDEMFASNEMDAQEKTLMKITEKAAFKKIMELNKNGKDTTIKINGASKDVTKFSFEIDDYDILDIERYMYEEILNNDDLINAMFDFDYLTLGEKKEILRDQIENLEVSDYSTINCKIDIYLQGENIVGFDLDYKETDSYWEEIEESSVKCTFRIDEEKFIEANLVRRLEEQQISYNFTAKQNGENKYKFNLNINNEQYMKFAINGHIEFSKEEIVKPSFSASVEQLDEETQAKLTAKIEEIVEKVGLKEVYEEYIRQQQEMLDRIQVIGALNEVRNVQDAIILQISENLANKYDQNIDDITRENMTKFDIILNNPLKTILNPNGPTGYIGTISIDGGEAVPVWKIDSTPEQLGITIAEAQLDKYVIDANGTVYYWNDGMGMVINDVAYYKTNVMRENPYTTSTKNVIAMSTIEQY